MNATWKVPSMTITAERDGTFTLRLGASVKARIIPHPDAAYDVTDAAGKFVAGPLALPVAKVSARTFALARWRSA